MDAVDRVTYQFEDTQDAEAVRSAYCALFNDNDINARIVLKHLVGICRWEDEDTCSDPIFNAIADSRRSIVRTIKKQLNMKPIELQEEGVVI